MKQYALGYKEIIKIPEGTKVKLLDYDTHLTANILRTTTIETINRLTRFVDTIGELHHSENSIFIDGIPFTKDDFVLVEVIE